MAQSSTPPPPKPLQRLPRNVAALLIFGRPPLVFFAFGCALWTMATNYPPAYLLGVFFLLAAMAFDWIDGWFADRYLPDSRLGDVVDRMMDRVVLSIIFPVLGAGMLWRYARVDQLGDPVLAKQHLLHALFVVGICVIVLMRDQFVGFLRSFAKAAGQEVESYELSRLRTMVASPMAVLLYAYAFYQPTEGWETLYRWLDWIDRLPLRVWFVGEMLFLVINIASATLNMRKYGAVVLDDITEDDELLRRRILAVIPNTLTLMNALLGITAVVFTSQGRVREALFVLVGAAFFDRLDGLMARRLGLTEPPKTDLPKPRFNSGALLDDISDAISFALVPAAIFYMVVSDLAVWPAPLPLPLVAGIAILYALAGISRLTYFTLDKHPIPGFFKGMPVPAAALFVTAGVEIVHQVSIHLPEYLDWSVRFATGLMIVAALIMNLFMVRYLHVGRLMGRRPSLLWGAGVLWLAMPFTPFFGATVLAILTFYLLSPLFTGNIDPAQANMESRTPPAQP